MKILTDEQKRRKAEAYRRWYSHPDRPKRTREWNERNPERILFKSLRSNAKARGRECELTFEELLEIVRPMVCSRTGLSLAWNGGPWAPSIDRKDNDLGYTVDNVELVCWAYNRARNKDTHEDVERMARALIAAIDCQTKETDR